jgi:hypothetical protein
MSSPVTTIVLHFDQSLPPVRFAVSEARRMLGAEGIRIVERPLSAYRTNPEHLTLAVAASLQDVIALARQAGLSAPSKIASQAFALRRKEGNQGRSINVLAHDAAGAMYGLLDVATALWADREADLQDTVSTPHIERRGIKFNIPLDARTPSYSDNSTAAQANIPVMWNFGFWRDFLDEMARHRFNVLTLWSLHPFPSIVRVPEYPEVALDDVMRTRLGMNETFTHSGSDMVREGMLDHLDTVYHISIDEKIAFWRDVMQYAADRAIEVYWFTWNIFTFGATGKHGITPAQDNPATIAYFRASVREMVLSYPLLAGIGITAGEQMENRDDEYAKERWLWATYGAGILDAKQITPDRKIRLIHRYHQTSQTEILEAWKDYPDTFELSFKYSIAHMYSIPNPPFVHEALEQLPQGRKLWLTVRNDDVYSFRWADVDYARDYIRAIPQPERIAGFYMGPDGYCWGRESLSKQPTAPRELVMRKQWYSFHLWGMLAYNPALPAAYFQSLLSKRFPATNIALLTRGWAAASSVFALITRFFWGDIDLRWFPEACLCHPRVGGFYTVRHFVEGVTMPGSNVMNLRQWRAKELGEAMIDGISPLEIANQLGNNALLALAVIVEIGNTVKPGTELARTVADIEAMGFLAHYYAAKIRAAAELAIYDRTGAPERQAAAVRILNEAAMQWRRYADVYTRQYVQPVLYNRVGFVDVKALQQDVEADVVIARTWQPGTVDDDLSNTRRGDRPFRA